MEQNRIAASGHHGHHEARAARANKGQPGQDNAAATPATGDGFALLLAALGGGQTDLDTGLAGDGQDSAGAALTADPLGGVAGLTQQDAAHRRAGVPDGAALAAMFAGAPMAGMQQPLAAGQLTPTAGGASAATIGDVMGALAGRVGLGLVRPGQDTLVGQTAQLDGAAETAALNGATRPMVASRGRGLAASGPQMLTGTGGVGSQGAQTHGAAALSAALQTAVAQVQSQLQTQVQTVAQPGSNPVPQGALAAHGTAALMQPDAAAVFAGQTLSGDGAATGSRRESVAGAQRLDDGTPGGQSVETAQPGADAVSGTSAADASTQTGGDDFSDQLAERVAYWVHQKTQSAEMTLDRDGRAVEVTVALKGDEAHVSFRSDHADARQWLNHSGDQLRDLLQREGLQLTGMSVGTSADGSAGSQRDGAAGRGRQRHAQVLAATPVGGVAPATGAGRAGASGVDLFV